MELLYIYTDQSSNHCFNWYNFFSASQNLRVVNQKMRQKNWNSGKRKNEHLPNSSNLNVPNSYTWRFQSIVLLLVNWDRSCNKLNTTIPDYLLHNFRDHLLSVSQILWHSRIYVSFSISFFFSFMNPLLLIFWFVA